MSRHNDLVRLHHMHDYAAEAVEMARGRVRGDLETDRMLVLALTRLVEIVGEAASRVSKTGQSAIPELPWPRISGMRNRLIHGYDQVDLDILWSTITENLPPIIAILDSVIARLESEKKE